MKYKMLISPAVTAAFLFAVGGISRSFTDILSQGFPLQTAALLAAQAHEKIDL